MKHLMTNVAQAESVNVSCLAAVSAILIAIVQIGGAVGAGFQGSACHNGKGSDGGSNYKNFGLFPLTFNHLAE